MNRVAVERSLRGHTVPLVSGSLVLRFQHIHFLIIRVVKSQLSAPGHATLGATGALLTCVLGATLVIRNNSRPRSGRPRTLPGHRKAADKKYCRRAQH